MAKHLFYGQVLPIPLKLDPDDLLDCGRASPRLFRLVSDWQVWAHLLRRVVQFSENKLDQLLKFRADGGSWFRVVCKLLQV